MKRSNDPLAINNQNKRYCCQQAGRTSFDNMSRVSSSIDIDDMDDKLLVFSPKQFKSPLFYPSSYPPSFTREYPQESPPASVAKKACPVPVRPHCSYNQVQPESSHGSSDDIDETTYTQQYNDPGKVPLQNQYLTPEYQGADEIICCSSPPFLRHKTGQGPSQHSDRLLLPLLPKQILTPNNDRGISRIEKPSTQLNSPVIPNQQKNNTISKPNIGSTIQSAFLHPPFEQSTTQITAHSSSCRASDYNDEKLLLVGPKQLSPSLKLPGIPMAADIFSGNEICNLPMRQSSYNPTNDHLDGSYRHFRSSPYFSSRKPRIEDTSPPSTSFPRTPN